MTDSPQRPVEWRVDFDADVEFSNGGGLSVEGFRLDIPGEDISDAALGELFVGHLGLLMVGRTVIRRKELIQEQHKGGRAVANANGPRRIVDLSGPAGAQLTEAPGELDGLVDLPGVLVRTLGSNSAMVDRAVLAPFDVRGRAVLVHAGPSAAITSDAARLLVERGAALVGTDSSAPSPADAELTEAGTPLVKGLNELDDLPPEGFRLHAVAYPTSTAARVYAVVDSLEPSKGA